MQVRQKKCYFLIKYGKKSGIFDIPNGGESVLVLENLTQQKKRHEQPSYFGLII